MLAWDEARGVMIYAPVTAVWEHRDPEVARLVINGETLTTTAEHPFAPTERGWVAAGDLRVGDWVRRGDGGTGIVEWVALDRQARSMYKLTVATAHTYVVGDGQWVVHNSCSLSIYQMNQAIRRGQAPRGITRVDRPKVKGEQLNVHFDKLCLLESGWNIEAPTCADGKLSKGMAHEQWMDSA